MNNKNDHSKYYSEQNHQITKQLLKLGKFVSGEIEFSMAKARMILTNHKKVIEQLKSVHSEPSTNPFYYDGTIALENYVFINTHNLSQDKFVLHELKDTAIIKPLFSRYTDNIKKQLSKIDGYLEKIEFLHFEKFQNREYIIAPEYNIEELASMPRMANTFLEHLIANTPKTSSEINYKKIRTNLSVKELALLFRLLKDLKILDKETETVSLSKTLSSVFSTKRKESVSHNTIKNHFEAPEETAIKFWEDQKQPIQYLLKKYKEI